jgi:hypothetical protein
MDVSSPRYYVDFFDAFDGWGHPFDAFDLAEGWGEWGRWPECLFDSLDEARACRDRLNASLPEGNRSVGEHWGIHDRTVGHEIECVVQRRGDSPAPVTGLLE